VVLDTASKEVFFMEVNSPNPRKFALGFSCRATRRRLSFSFPNVRSESPRLLCRSSPYSIAAFRFLRPGVTGTLSFDSRSHRSQSPSYPPSAWQSCTSSASSHAAFASSRLPSLRNSHAKYPLAAFALMQVVVMEILRAFGKMRARSRVVTPAAA